MKSKLAKFVLLLAFGLALTFAFSCSPDDGDNNSGKVTACTAANNTSTQYCSNGTMKTYGSTPAIGGRTYKTIEIGSQTWMAENLNYNASGSVCYDNNSTKCNQYGRLYNLQTAMTVCPSGWRLPSKAEWEALMVVLGDPITAGNKLKAINGWDNGGNGTDDYGFSALPGGISNSDGDFIGLGIRGCWWGVSEDGNEYAYYRIIEYFYGNIGDYDNYDNGNLLSVRCVKGLSSDSPSSSDNGSGSIYSSSGSGTSGNYCYGYYKSDTGYRYQDCNLIGGRWITDEQHCFSGGGILVDADYCVSNGIRIDDTPSDRFSSSSSYHAPSSSGNGDYCYNYNACYLIGGKFITDKQHCLSDGGNLVDADYCVSRNIMTVCEGYCQWDDDCFVISTDPTGQYGRIISSCEEAILDCKSFSQAGKIFSNSDCTITLGGSK